MADAVLCGGYEIDRRVLEAVVARCLSTATVLESGCRVRPTRSGRWKVSLKLISGKYAQPFVYRLVYVLAHGSTESDLDHTCNNKACIELSHLVLTTKSENSRLQHVRDPNAWKTLLKSKGNRRGATLSAESRARISASKKAAKRVMTDSEKEHLRNYWKGRVFSEETRAKISAAKQRASRK